MATEEIQQAWDSEIDLREILEIIWRGKWIIVGFIIVAALITGFISTQLLEPTYEATATLLIMPPTYQTSIEPKPLELETYKNLALTPEVASQIIKKLELRDEEGELLPASVVLNNLSVDIAAQSQNQSESSQKTGVLHLKATWSDPITVRDMANTWAQIFMETTSNIRKSESEDIAEVILNQFESTENALIQAENRLLEFRSQSQLPIISRNVSLYLDELHERTAYYENLLRDLEVKQGQLDSVNKQLESIEVNGVWIGLRNLTVPHQQNDDPLRRRILTAKEKYEQAEKELQKFDDNSQITLLQQQLELHKQKAAEFRNILTDLSSKEATLPAKREALEKTLKQQQARLVMNRSITNDALWMTLGQKSDTLKDIEHIKLADEMPNPNYQYIEKTLTDTILEAQSLPTVINTYQELLNYSTSQITELEASIRALQQEREILAQQLELAKNTYDTLKTQYTTLKEQALSLSLEIEQLESELAAAEQDMYSFEKKASEAQQKLLALQLEEERLVREKNTVQKTYSTLANHAEVARITELQATGDVRFISQAVVPDRPSGPRHMLNIAISIVLSGMLGLGTVFIMNLFQTQPSRNNMTVTH